jgi:osmotically-inducible protein OsmY
MRQLEQDPQVDATDIAVLARSGSVTLTGYVNSYARKLAAEQAAARVRGVRVVANEIEVRPKVERVDADIAADVAQALDLWTVPATIKASVHDGYVTLTGDAKWLPQRRDLENAIRHIRGVRRILNKVILTGSVRSRLQPESVQRVTTDVPGIAQVGDQIGVVPEPLDEMC